MHWLKNAMYVRAEHIIMRSNNAFFKASKAYYSLTQHLNPACRAARLYPNSSVALFAMQVCDYDFPVLQKSFFGYKYSKVLIDYVEMIYIFIR